MTARVRFAHDIAWWALRRLGREPVHRQDLDDGTLVLEIAVTNVDAFLSWLLGFGEQAELLEPETMRRALIDRIRGVA